MGLKKDEALKKINESKDESFEVFTEQEHTTYLDNFAKTEVEKKIGDEISKVHSQYDNDAFEILGERKAGNEKTYNFLKRKLKELKESASGSQVHLDRIKQLENDLKNKSGDEQLKKDYEQLRKTYNDDKQTWDAKTQEYIKSQESMQVEIQLDNALPKLKFSDKIPETVRDVMIRAAKAKLLQSGKIVDKQLIFLDKDGATLRNKNNALNPFTAEEMLTAELKDILGETKVIPGTGVKPQVVKDKDGKESIPLQVPDSVRTKEELSKYLMSLGLNRNSKEYTLAYKEYGESLPVK
jgi:hypothetical protein